MFFVVPFTSDVKKKKEIDISTIQYDLFFFFRFFLAFFTRTWNKKNRRENRKKEKKKTKRKEKKNSLIFDRNQWKIKKIYIHMFGRIEMEKYLAVFTVV